MSDLDKLEFDKWWKNVPIEFLTSASFESFAENGFKAACNYKQKEIDDLKGMLKSAIYVYEEQKERILDEGTKIKKALGKTTNFIKKVSGDAYEGQDNAHDLHAEYLDYRMQKEAQKILDELQTL